MSKLKQKQIENLVSDIAQAKTRLIVLYFPADAISDAQIWEAINLPFAGTVDSITTISASGTCTLTGSINGTNLGGTANSVSTTEQTQTHSTANSFVSGDDIELTASSNSSCAGMAVTVKLTLT